jgi:hypothetical protein
MPDGQGQCPPGHVFCLTINACVKGDNCMAFDDDNADNSTSVCQVKSFRSAFY